MQSSRPCFTPGPCRRRHGDTVRAGDGGDTVRGETAETRRHGQSRRRRSRRHGQSRRHGNTSEQETAETRRHSQRGDVGDTETRSEQETTETRRHIGAGDRGDTETRSEQETSEARRHGQRRDGAHGDTVRAETALRDQNLGQCWLNTCGGY